MAAVSPPLVLRDIFDRPPPPNLPFSHSKPTLLFSYWCTGFSLLIIIVRLFGRMIRNNQLFREDWIMFWSIVPLLIRQALVHIVLLWGTNNIDISAGLSPQEIFDRSVGSRAVLASRVFYALL
jgi:hypothetical protein